MPQPSSGLRLNGVDHTAFPTARPKETIEFYRDVMGLPVLHAITAKGWGWKGGYPDFFHFFFDAGNGSSIAFFYHVGAPPPPRPADPLGYQAQARHTAWLVDTQDEMVAWHRRLKAKGVKVTPQVRHELIESIYFLDPNDYPLEITWRLRPLDAIDRDDAELTLEAIAETFGPNPSGDTIRDRTIADMWRLKAAKVRGKYGFDADGRLCPALYVPRVPEYRPLLDHARAANLAVSTIADVYDCLSSPTMLTLDRADAGLIEALWFSMPVGGLCGDIETFSADRLVIRAPLSAC